MKIEKFGIYLADLDPPMGTEPGKIRPVVVVQTDLLNVVHGSTVVCPMTTNLADAHPIRLLVRKQEGQLTHDSDIMIDQIRAIDNHRFKRRIGKLPLPHQRTLLENLSALIME